MQSHGNDLDALLDDVSACSAGGAPFLAAYGLTLAACGALAFVVPAPVAALTAMFQGVVALPLAFLLERVMGAGPMRPDHPLRPLSVQLAMSQVLALPAVILAYNYHASTVPIALGAIGGAHFLPYAWLQRTPVYSVLGVAVSLGPFALALLFQRAAMPWSLLWIAAAYAVAAPLVYRRAARLVAARRG
jgi:hypothetical protein